MEEKERKNHVTCNDSWKSSCSSYSDSDNSDKQYSSLGSSMSSYERKEYPKENLRDIYLVTQELQEGISKKTFGRKIQQKERNRKEGKCFICKEKGHKMKECKWKKEFKRYERYCYNRNINVWDRWKEFQPVQTFICKSEEQNPV